MDAMRILTVLVLMAGVAWGQEKPPADKSQIPNSETKLTRQEVLEWRVLGLEIGQFQMMATTCLPDPKRPIQEQLDQINKEIQARQVALEKVAADIVKSRNLDLAKFRVNWQKEQVEPIPAKP